MINIVKKLDSFFDLDAWTRGYMSSWPTSACPASRSQPLTRPLCVQVVMLNSRQTMIDTAPQRAALELSMIIDTAEQRRNVSGSSRKSSMVAWETTLEDVIEDEEEEEQESSVQGTVLEAEGEEDEEDKDKTMEENVVGVGEQIIDEFMDCYSIDLQFLIHWEGMTVPEKLDFTLEKCLAKTLITPLLFMREE